MSFVRVSGRNKRFKSKQHQANYYAKLRKAKANRYDGLNLGWSWRPPEDKRG